MQIINQTYMAYMVAVFYPSGKRLTEIILTSQASRFSAGTIISRTQAPHGACFCYSPLWTPAWIQHYIKSQQRCRRPNSHSFHTDLRSPLRAFVLQLHLLMVAAEEDFGERRDGAGQNINNQCNETCPLKGTCGQNNLLVRDNSIARSWYDRLSLHNIVQKLDWNAHASHI